jgi:hypothetical protein
VPEIPPLVRVDLPILGLNEGKRLPALHAHCMQQRSLARPREHGVRNCRRMDMAQRNGGGRYGRPRFSQYPRTAYYSRFESSMAMNGKSLVTIQP